MQTRDAVTIRNRAIPHRTACRDYVCGTCGSALVTRAAPWRTVCAEDEAHPISEFVTKMAWRTEEARLALEDDRARMIFQHLPSDLRAAIQEQERETCRSRD